MDVRKSLRAVWPILLAAFLHHSAGINAQADPMYTMIDLGTGPAVGSVGANGDGTITGSNGQTYTFNPAQNALPAQWTNTSVGVPMPVAPPTGSPDTNGNPNYAYSQSTLTFMNSQGLAAGLDVSGVSGHLSNSEAFLTQQQADGSWGTPIPLWSGESTFSRGGSGAGILGISQNGQVLGIGYNLGQLVGYGSNPSGYGLFLYDSNLKSFTNLSTLINSTSTPGNTNWFLNSPYAQIDSQGRILLTNSVTEGYPGTTHSLLLVPEGLSAGPVATPEPATWAIFATLTIGWMARKRLRPGMRRRVVQE